jgi:hypothetical protein
LAERSTVIVEVNESGEILTPAELVQAPPHTRLEAERDGNAVILEPIADKPARKARPISSLPVLEGRLADPAMAFRREDIYGSDGR